MTQKEGLEEEAAIPSWPNTGKCRPFQTRQPATSQRGVQATKSTYKVSQTKNCQTAPSVGQLSTTLQAGISARIAGSMVISQVSVLTLTKKQKLMPRKYTS